jgi:hypothetical protein
MIRRRRTFGLMIVFMTLAAALPATDVQVTIRLYDEEVYFPDSTIHIHVQVWNRSAERQQFRLADDRMFNLDFDVTGPDNRRVDGTPQFTIGRSSNQVFYRTVVLEPDDRFSFVERLDSFVRIDQPATYTVQASFYPSLHMPQQTNRAIRSNAITLVVRPGYSQEIRQDMRFEQIAELALQRERLSPDEIVDLMIAARRENNWERFFLHVNLEKIYRQAAERNRRFQLMGEREQLELLRQFRTSLQQQPDIQDAELVLIPDDYEILETRYSMNEGSVVVRMYYDHLRFRERKLYTFRFERRNGFWEVIAYQVQNLPNEARQR